MDVNVPTNGLFSKREKVVDLPQDKHIIKGIDWNLDYTKELLVDSNAVMDYVIQHLDTPEVKKLKQKLTDAEVLIDKILVRRPKVPTSGMFPNKKDEDVMITALASISGRIKDANMAIGYVSKHFGTDDVKKLEKTLIDAKALLNKLKKKFDMQTDSHFFDNPQQGVPIVCQAPVIDDDMAHDLRSRRSSSVAFSQPDDEFISQLKANESWKRLTALQQRAFRNWYFLHKLNMHAKDRKYYYKHSEVIWQALKVVYRKPFIFEGEVRWDNSRLIKLAVHLGDSGRLATLRETMSVKDGLLVGQLVNQKREKTRRVIVKNMTDKPISLRKKIGAIGDRELKVLAPNKRYELKTRLGNVYSWYGKDDNPLQNGEFSIGRDVTTYYYDSKTKRAIKK